MLQGLYRAEFETYRGKAIGVVFAKDGKIHGDDSAFAYIGTYQQVGHTINGAITTFRHTNAPKHPALFDVENAKITLRGFEKDGFATLNETANGRPSLGLKIVLMLLCD